MSFGTACARVDITKRVDGSLGIPFSVYEQRGETISRWDLADELEADVTTRDAVSGHDPWAYTGISLMILGTITAAIGLGMATNERRNDDAGLYVGIAGLSGLGAGLIADLIARIHLDSAIDLHNRQLSGLAAPTPVGREHLDPDPSEEMEDVEW